MSSIERRFVANTASMIELEARAGEPVRFVGYGARYYDGSPGTEFKLWEHQGPDGKMRRAVERIMPGAFDRALQSGDDVRLLYNHDPSMLLARVSSGTLKLATFAAGLRYIGTAPDTQLSRDLQELIRRGDVSGSSFSFTLQSGDDEWRSEDDGLEIRSIKNFSRVYDVGPVTFPAYEATTTGIRSVDAEGFRYYHNQLTEARASYDAWQRQVNAERDRITRRAQYVQAMERIER